tara:strand:- start:838 stop:1209 length:372 start_codon:yes stop_codon:yes gene_type:complete
MEYCSNFRYDLKVGQVAEKQVADLLQDKKIEVKRDLKAKTTGNLYIEYESRGKPSGISRSEADYWCFAFENLFIFIETTKLKEMIEPMKGSSMDKRGGDKNSSKGILLPLERLTELKNNGELS